jgi:hypothetical protein
VYGYDDGSTLDRWDLELLHHMTRTYFNAKQLDSGDGVITDAQREMLRAKGVL